MSLLKKIFKKEKPREAMQESVAFGRANDSVVEEYQEPAIDQSDQNDNASRAAFGVLRRQHITEKTMADAERGRYTFVVADGACKREVARSVAARFRVNPVAVHMLTMPGKERRRGRQVGWKSGFKKAMVTLTKGQKIDAQ